MVQKEKTAAAKSLSNKQHTQRQWGDRHIQTNKNSMKIREKTTIVELFSFFYNVNDENVLITSETSLSMLTRSFHPSVRTHIIPWIERTKQMPIRWYMQGKMNGKQRKNYMETLTFCRDRERSSPTESEQETRMSLLCNSFLLPINQWDLWILTCSSSSVRVMPFGTVTHSHSSIAFFLVINVRMGSMLINAFLFK